MTGPSTLPGARPRILRIEHRAGQNQAAPLSPRVTICELGHRGDLLLTAAEETTLDAGGTVVWDHAYVIDLLAFYEVTMAERGQRALDLVL